MVNGVIKAGAALVVGASTGLTVCTSIKILDSGERCSTMSLKLDGDVNKKGDDKVLESLRVFRKQREKDDVNGRKVAAVTGIGAALFAAKMTESLLSSEDRDEPGYAAVQGPPNPNTRDPYTSDSVSLYQEAAVTRET